MADKAEEMYKELVTPWEQKMQKLDRQIELVRDSYRQLSEIQKCANEQVLMLEEDLASSQIELVELVNQREDLD